MNNKSLAKTQKEDKLEFVMEFYVKRGFRYSDVVKMFVEKFGDCDRNAKKYIEKVKKEMTNPKKEHHSYLHNQTYIRLNDLYNKLYEQGDYKGSGAILNQIIKMYGLEAPRQLDINQNVNHNAIDLSAIPLEVLMQLNDYAEGHLIEGPTVEVEAEEIIKDDDNE